MLTQIDMSNEEGDRAEQSRADEVRGLFHGHRLGPVRERE